MITMNEGKHSNVLRNWGNVCMHSLFKVRACHVSKWLFRSTNTRQDVRVTLRHHLPSRRFLSSGCCHDLFELEEVPVESFRHGGGLSSRSMFFFGGRNENSLQNIFVGHMKPPSRRWQRHRKWFQTILNQCFEPIYLLDVVVTFHLRRC